MQDTGSNTSTFHDLGVSKRNPNDLTFYFMYTANGAGFSVSVYDKFRNGDPPDALFNVPAVCHVNGLGDMSTEYSGQIPQRPKLAESFSAEVSVQMILTLKVCICAAFCTVDYICQDYVLHQ